MRSVTVLEGYERLGGTTALSGGNAWLPGNDHTPDDTAEAGLAYLRALALGDADDELLAGVRPRGGADRGAARARDAGPLAADRLLRLPRAAPERPAASRADARSSRKPIDPDARARELVRDAPNVTAPVTYVELATGEIDRRSSPGAPSAGR